MRTGSSRVDINVALLAFDGRQFKTRWARQNLAAGEVKIHQTGIQLEYRDYYADGPNFHEVIEELTFTSEGLAVRSREVKK